MGNFPERSNSMLTYEGFLCWCRRGKENQRGTWKDDLLYMINRKSSFIKWMSFSEHALNFQKELALNYSHHLHGSPTPEMKMRFTIDEGAAAMPSLFGNHPHQQSCNSFLSL